MRHKRPLARKKPDEPSAYPDEAVEPGLADANAYNNAGNVLQSQHKLHEAIACYGKSIALDPNLAEAYNNLGPALVGVGRPELAMACYRQALLLRPAYAQAHCNMANLLQSRAQFAEAAVCYRTALDLDPDLAEAHYGLGTLLLRQGDLAAGWTEYEWRWKTPLFVAPRRHFSQPQWHGEAAAGRSLLVHIEQGSGDTIQFCRYVPLLAARGLTVILEVHKPLVRLLRHLPGISHILAHGDALPAFDLHCPIHSLPFAFGTTLATIPATDAYLHADAAEVARWDVRLRAMANDGKRVGLAWAGNPAHAADRQRSIAPERLAPLVAVPGLNFFSLQKDAPAAPFAPSDFMGEMADFADTAALIANLDLIVTVDTAIAHLAAALGKPVWLLDRFDSDWRWLVGRRDSPWYPTLRIYRQPSPDDWESPIAEMVRDLRAPAARDITV